MNTTYNRIAQHRYAPPSQQQRDLVPDYSPPQRDFARDYPPPQRDFARDYPPPKRDFARDFGSSHSDQGEGLNGTMLFYIALGISGAIFVLSMMINAAVH